MFNKKVILICGYSRGGTNILWNILQSHPKICSTRHELGSIFKKTKYLKFSRFISIARKLGILHTSLTRFIIDYQLHRYKMETLWRRDNQFKTENNIYSREEVKNAALCLKSVDWDIHFTELLLEIYPDMYIIMLTRNGYAVANGHLRRGISIPETATLYKEIGRIMHSISHKHPKTFFVKFEDFIGKPFEIAEKLYQFTETEPSEIERLRLKSKIIVNEDKIQVPKFGEVNRKYWFGRDTVADLIDTEINQKQINQLSPDQIKEYNSIAADILTEFGYDVLNPETV